MPFNSRRAVESPTRHCTALCGSPRHHQRLLQEANYHQVEGCGEGVGKHQGGILVIEEHRFVGNNGTMHRRGGCALDHVVELVVVVHKHYTASIDVKHPLMKKVEQGSPSVSSRPGACTESMCTPPQ